MTLADGQGAGWIGCNDRIEHIFDPGGLVAADIAPQGVTPAAGLLPRGSIVVEFRPGVAITVPAPADPPAGRPRRRRDPPAPAPRAAVLHPARCLLAMRLEAPWTVALGLDLLSDGSIVLTQVQGREHRAFRLGPVAADPADVLRVTFSWDAPCRRGTLTCENLTRGSLRQSDCTAPLPMFLFAAEALVSDPAAMATPATALVAVSDRIEPVGPMPGLQGDAQLMTPEGPRRVCDLRAGESVLTRDAGWQPVLWSGGRDVLARGQLQPVGLRAPFRGIEEDLILAPTQRVLAEGPDVEYLFGESEVFLSAADLVDGRTAVVLREPPVIRLHHVLLETHAVLWVSGGWSESLFAGGLAGSPALAATSVLAGVAGIPAHRARARRTLKPYEAASLLAALDSRNAPRAA